MAFVDKKESGFKTVIKGFLTGGTQACITYPTEFSKTQLQLQSKAKPQFSGMIDVWVKTVKEYGPSGVYRGAGVRIIGAGFQQMFRWGGYTNISFYLRDDKGKITKTNNALAGLGAGVCEAVFAVTPVETIKTRVTDDQRLKGGKYSGSTDAIKKILRSEGPAGLYRGAAPTILKQATNQAVRMPLQQVLHGALTNYDESKAKDPVLNGCSGTMAGFGSVVLTQPQDNVKSRMQGEGSKLYKGTVDCAVQMFKTDGPKQFFAGTIPRGVQVGMTTGISFFLYPIISKKLNTMW